MYHAEEELTVRIIPTFFRFRYAIWLQCWQR